MQRPTQNSYVKGDMTIQSPANSYVDEDITNLRPAEKSYVDEDMAIGGCWCRATTVAVHGQRQAS
jgi:hypothetical protein